MPTQPTVLATTSKAILQYLVAYLADRLKMDPNRIIVTARDPDEVPHFGAEQDILVKAGDERPQVGIIDGAGRFDNRRDLDIEITMRTRLLLDLPGRDKVRLLAEDDSHKDLEDRVADILECLWFPTDEDDNALLVAPMRLGRLAGPTRDKQLGKESGWIRSTWHAEVTYRRALDTSLLLDG